MTTRDKFRFLISDPRNFVKKVLIKFLHKTSTIWSDILYIKIIYKLTFNKNLDLNNPKTFNEKLQWLKLYNRKPEYTAMDDKYEVKNMLLL